MWILLWFWWYHSAWKRLWCKIWSTDHIGIKAVKRRTREGCSRRTMIMLCAIRSRHRDESEDSIVGRNVDWGSWTPWYHHYWAFLWQKYICWVAPWVLIYACYLFMSRVIVITQLNSTIRIKKMKKTGISIWHGSRQPLVKRSSTNWSGKPLSERIRALVWALTRVQNENERELKSENREFFFKFSENER